MEEQKKQHRLLLMPSPLQGHITPLLHLAQILFSKGFSITILHTLYNSPDPTSYPQFSFHAIPDGLSESETATLDSVNLTALINIRCLHPLKEYLLSLLSDSLQSVPCFISDAALHFTQSVCDEFKLPRLVLRTGGASSFLVFASFPLLREKGYLPVQGSLLLLLFLYFFFFFFYQTRLVQIRKFLVLVILLIGLCKLGKEFSYCILLMTN